MARRRARATAVAVLPTPVGPAITTRGARSIMRTLPVPFELAPDVGERDPTHDGPAVRTEVRRGRVPEVGEQPLHFLARERSVRLHGGAARHERERALDRGRTDFRSAEIL